MASFSNPLATVEQVFSISTDESLPTRLQDSVRFSTSKLTQAACILLRLPQDIAAQAVVILQRYWLVDPIMRYEFSDVSAASVYLTAKLSASPRSLRSVTNVYAYLLSVGSVLYGTSLSDDIDPGTYYLSESSYVAFRNRLLDIEGQILNGIGFNIRVALPHTLAVTYLQTLDMFTAAHPPNTGSTLARKTVAYLNSLLLSPQTPYLTQQPTSLATAAIYLASKDTGVKLPDIEWWEIFDVDREDLGYIVLAAMSLEEWTKKEAEMWGGRHILTRAEISKFIPASSTANGHKQASLDEEDEMAILMDNR